MRRLILLASGLITLCATPVQASERDYRRGFRDGFDRARRYEDRYYDYDRYREPVRSSYIRTYRPDYLQDRSYSTYRYESDYRLPCDPVVERYPTTYYYRPAPTSVTIIVR